MGSGMMCKKMDMSRNGGMRCPLPVDYEVEAAVAMSVRSIIVGTRQKFTEARQGHLPGAPLAGLNYD